MTFLKMKPSWLQEIVLVGKPEDVQQDGRNVLRVAILEIMVARFNPGFNAGKAVEESLDEIEDLLLLGRLAVGAATVESLEEFSAKLQE